MTQRDLAKMFALMQEQQQMLMQILAPSAPQIGRFVPPQMPQPQNLPPTVRVLQSLYREKASQGWVDVSFNVAPKQVVPAEEYAAMFGKGGVCNQNGMFFTAKGGGRWFFDGKKTDVAKSRKFITDVLLPFVTKHGFTYVG